MSAMHVNKQRLGLCCLKVERVECDEMAVGSERLFHLVQVSLCAVFFRTGL